jgi:uncharacterized tellurite resistance protein B-like protein
MGGLLLLLLIVAAACAGLFFPNEISRLCNYLLSILHLTTKQDEVHCFSQQNCQPVQNQTDAIENVPDLNVLNCRIQETIQKEENSEIDAFSVDICGSIHAPADLHHTTLKVTIQDVTDGPSNVRPVQARVKQCQAPASSDTGQAGEMPVYCHSADLGRLPHKTTVLSDWTSVAKLRVDWLLFARKGQRSLQFNVSILSAKDGMELANASCSYIYDNPSFGYIDMQENAEHSKTLAVALAFAVSAADGRIYECEIELIKKWAKDNINLTRSSDKAERELDKALNEVITFYRQGNKLDTFNICREVVAIAPIAGRCEILELCFNVAKANGNVVAEELKFLKELANQMEIEGGRFRELMEKVIPLEMHEVKDIESILGVTSDMNTEIARARLNKEYVKWNARVTNTNPKVQNQADQMLKLIAEARSQYIVSETDLRQENNEPDHSEPRASTRQGKKSKSRNSRS